MYACLFTSKTMVHHDTVEAFAQFAEYKDVCLHREMASCTCNLFSCLLGNNVYWLKH